MIRRKRSPLNAILTVVTRSVMGLGLLYLYILYNLAHYSVYYASKMPHSSDVRPIPIMLVQNMLFLDLPKNEETYYFNESDGGIVNRDLEVWLGKDTIEGEKVQYAFSLSEWRQDEVPDKWAYYLDNKGRFLFYTPDIWVDELVQDSSPERAKELDELLDKVLSPYLKDYPKPVINLQWLFNWKYQDQFK